MTRSYPDRRDVLAGIAAVAAGIALPMPAPALPPLETWVGPGGMASIAAGAAAVIDAAGLLTLSTEARDDLTAFIGGHNERVTVRLNGPRDADAVRAILLHGPGFPGRSVLVEPRRDGTRRLIKLA